MLADEFYSSQTSSSTQDISFHTITEHRGVAEVGRDLSSSHQPADLAKQTFIPTGMVAEFKSKDLFLQNPDHSH